MSRFPWHEPLLTQLRVQRDRGQLPHAVGLSCVQGWGTRELLIDVCETLLELKIHGEVAEFAHPDFRWVEPDGAEIKIDQVRRASEFAVQTVQSAPRKVIAFADAHKMNDRAANALLKTLEEPPRSTHLVMATTSWGRMLPTIRSRCQRLEVSPDQSIAVAWLAEQGIAVSKRAYAEAGFAPLAAARAAAAEQPTIDDWLEGLGLAQLSNGVSQALEWDLLDLMGRWYRRLILHLGGQQIGQLSASGAQVTQFADQILSARRQLESSNSANARVLLEGLIVRWLKLCSQQDKQGR